MNDPSRTPQSASPRTARLHYAFIAAAVLAAHGSMLTRELVWDDHLILDQMGVAGRWRLFEPDPFGFVRPGKILLFSILDNFFGRRPVGWMVVGLASILATSLLLYRFAREYLSAPGALIAALVYAVHPLHVEGAGWAAANNGTILAACALAYYIVLFRLWRRPSPIHFAATVALIFAAVLMKEEAIVIPVLGALCLHAAGARFDRRIVAALGVHMVIAGGFILFNRWMALGIGQSLIPYPYSDVILSLTGPRTILSHVFYFAYPFYWGYYTSFDEGPILFFVKMFAGLALAALFVRYLWRNRRRLPLPAFGLAFTIVAIAPMANLLPMRNSWFGVRYLTHAGVGLALLAGFGFMRSYLAPERWGYRMRLCVVVWLVAAVAASNVFHQLWRNDESLFTRIAFATDNVHLAIDSAYFRAQLAREMIKRKRYREAESLIRLAIELDPTITAYYVVHGTALNHQGRIEEAVQSWAKAERLEPGDIDAAVHLGFYHDNRYGRLRSRGDLERAEHYYRIATSGRTVNAEVAYVNLGLLWATEGDESRAVMIWKAGLEKFPRSAALRRNVDHASARLAADRRAAKAVASGAAPRTASE